MLRCFQTDTANNGQGIARSTKTGNLDSNCVAEWNETTCEMFAARQVRAGPRAV